MKKTLSALLAILLLIATCAYAQDDEPQDKTTPVRTPVWTKVVWRTLEIADTNANAVLQCMTDSKGNKTDLNLLLAKAVKAHAITAYSVTGNFKTMDTSSEEWQNGARITRSKHNTEEGDDEPEQKSLFEKMENFNDAALFTSHKYFIEENWTYIKEVGKIVVTVEWIGPCGKDEHGELKPLFAVQYQELLPLLNQYALCPASKDDPVITCSDFFESRQFSGVIIKTARPHDNAAVHDDD